MWWRGNAYWTHGKIAPHPKTTPPSLSRCILSLIPQVHRNFQESLQWEPRLVATCWFLHRVGAWQGEDTGSQKCGASACWCMEKSAQPRKDVIGEQHETGTQHRDTGGRPSSLLPQSAQSNLFLYDSNLIPLPEPRVCQQMRFCALALKEGTWNSSNLLPHPGGQNPCGFSQPDVT